MTGDLDDFVLSMLGTVHCRKCVGTSARGRVLPRRSPPPLYCPVDEGSRDPAPWVGLRAGVLVWAWHFLRFQSRESSRRKNG
jgi:hypothetical protein